MERIINRQWRDEQAAGKYPFADYATLQSRDGISLAADTFLDAHLYPIGSSAGLYIPRIDVLAATVKLYVGTNDDQTLCYGEFDPLNPPEILPLIDTYGRAAGVLVAPPLGLSIAQSWTQGTHLFERAATEFVAGVCCPQPAIGVRGFLTDKDELLSGDVWIVGEHGVIVREDPDLSLAGSIVLRIDVIGEPLFKRVQCNFETPQFLKTINNVPPDVNGNFVIQVGTASAADPLLRIGTTRQLGDLHFALVGQATENP
jgi:hypothetical protein